MSVLNLEKPLKTAAAGQYLVYSLQQLLLCHHLLKAPDGNDASLEYLDDVAVHRADGTLREQSKSALSGQPSQVYFPRGFDLVETVSPLGRSRDEDIAVVRKSSRRGAGEIVRAEGQLLVIASDHPGANFWGEIDGVTLVAEWRGAENPVPPEWLELSSAIQ